MSAETDQRSSSAGRWWLLCRNGRALWLALWLAGHQHLHRDDYPATVAFLTDVWGDRPEVVIDVTDVGVKVSWMGEGLSSTEAAVLQAVRVRCPFQSA